MSDVYSCDCGAPALEMTPWCGACWEKRRAAEEAAAEQAWRAEIKQLGRIAGAPAFPFANLQNADFLRMIAGKKLLTVGQRYALERSLVFTGPSGVGKTTVVRAMLRRLLRQEVEKVLGGPVGAPPSALLKRLSRTVWTDGFSLAQARRQAPMGRGEAELVERAFRAPVLVLDEVGQEPLSEIVFEVADRRYRDGSLTILTTGLKPAEFAERYGHACWRRLSERAAVVEEW